MPQTHPDRAANEDIVPLKPWNQGVAWKNGKHYSFSESAITVAKSWPELLVWQRTRTQPWQGLRYWPLAHQMRQPKDEASWISMMELMLEGNGPKDGPTWSPRQTMASLIAARCMYGFLTQIPSAVLTRTLRFEDRRWQLLRFQSRVQGAADLLDSSPALGWMLANHWIFRRGIGRNDSTRFARRWIGLRQRQILGHLGFEDSESTRRVIARIPPTCVNVGTLLHVRDALRHDEQRKLLEHLPHVTFDVMQIVRDEELRSRVTTAFLRDVSERSREDESNFLANLLSTCLSNEPHVWPRLKGKLRTVEQLKDLVSLQEMNERMRMEEICLFSRIARQGSDKLVFPVPPWPGLPGLEPLTDLASLRLEGLEMRHCAGSYGQETAEGSAYLYRVTQPTRATLALRRVDDAWNIDQIRGPRNKRVDPVNERAIRQLVATGLGASRASSTLELSTKPTVLE